MKWVAEEDNILVVQAENEKEKELLCIVRDYLLRCELPLIRFKGFSKDICAIEVENIHKPFVPDNKDLKIVKNILKKKGK